MMSMDTNVLLYSLNPDSKWHEASAKFLQQYVLDSNVRVAITDYVLMEL